MNPLPLPEYEIFLRLGSAFLAGLILGVEREMHGRAAGLRTVLLMTVVAAVAMILSESFYLQKTTAGANWAPDPARLAAGILTGMGFLGGGAILRQGNLVKGVTTAAVLWSATILGLCFGNGQFLLGGISLGVTLFGLIVLLPVENRIRKDSYATLSVVLPAGGMTNEELSALIEQKGISIRSFGITYDVPRQTRTIHCYLKFKRHARQNAAALSQEIIEDVLAQPGILKVKWS